MDINKYKEDAKITMAGKEIEKKNEQFWASVC